MEKFDFSILTRDGQKVDSIVISGATKLKRNASCARCTLLRDCELQRKRCRGWEKPASHVGRRHPLVISK